MTNTEAQRNISLCNEELDKIDVMIENILGHTSPIIPFLTKYSIVRACGTIEYCFKTIISDLHSGNSPQITNYIDNTIRNSSMNPSISNICKTLKKFDENWNDDFKKQLKKHTKYKRLIDSIDSLNNARNSFAHGGTPSASFENIRNYYKDTVIIIEILDNVVNQ